MNDQFIPPNWVLVDGTMNQVQQATPARVGPGAIAQIRERIADLKTQHTNYLAYQQDRVGERDHHGAWDVAINLSETECEIAGLEFALRALEEEHGA